MVYSVWPAVAVYVARICIAVIGVHNVRNSYSNLNKHCRNSIQHSDSLVPRHSSPRLYHAAVEKDPGIRPGGILDVLRLVPLLTSETFLLVSQVSALILPSGVKRSDRVKCLYVQVKIHKVATKLGTHLTVS